jgi:hypothetical protein
VSDEGSETTRKIGRLISMAKNSNLYGDDFDDSDDQGGDLVSQLRRANKAQAKSLKELTEKYDLAETARADLATKVNGNLVSEMLKAKGLDPGVSKFAKDVEPTQEAIDAWLTENGKLFGYDPNKGSGDAEGGKTAEQVAAEAAAASAGNNNLSPEMLAFQKALGNVQDQEANAATGNIAGDPATEALRRLGEGATSFEDVERGLKQMGLVPSFNPQS